MTTLYNEITIAASLDKVWSILTEIDLLEKYDPTVKESVITSAQNTGLGAKRKVHMKNGKNWFDEKITEFKSHEKLTFQLTDCTFPIHGLKHKYSFEQINNQVKVKQVMEYTVKFGLLGRLLDLLMIRKQTDGGVKKFMTGLKSYAEAK